MTEVYDWSDDKLDALINENLCNLKRKLGTAFMIFPNEAARILDIMEGLNASGSRRDQDELRGILKVLGLFNISEDMLKKVSRNAS